MKMRKLENSNELWLWRRNTRKKTGNEKEFCLYLKMKLILGKRKKKLYRKIGFQFPIKGNCLLFNVLTYCEIIFCIQFVMIGINEVQVLHHPTNIFLLYLFQYFAKLSLKGLFLI